MKRPLFTKQSRAARWRLAGRMRPAGRGLPTADLEESKMYNEAEVENDFQ
jgi:hypothetical protein